MNGMKEQIESLERTIQKVQLDLKRDRAKNLKIQQKENNLESEKIDNKFFNLLKDLTILSGTVFASTIALSTGKNTNVLFKIGEISLFISISIGILILWNRFKMSEYSYFFKIKNQLEGDLIIYKYLMEDFEKKATQDQIDIYSDLLFKNKNSKLNYLFKFIKIDAIPTLFFIFFFSGVLLLLMSILNLNINSNSVNESWEKIHNLF